MKIKNKKLFNIVKKIKHFILIQIFQQIIVVYIKIQQNHQNLQKI